MDEASNSTAAVESSRWHKAALATYRRGARGSRRRAVAMASASSFWERPQENSAAMVVLMVVLMLRRHHDRGPACIHGKLVAKNERAGAECSHMCHDVPSGDPRHRGATGKGGIFATPAFLGLGPKPLGASPSARRPFRGFIKETVGELAVAGWQLTEADNGRFS